MTIEKKGPNLVSKNRGISGCSRPSWVLITEVVSPRKSYIIPNTVAAKGSAAGNREPF